MWPPRVQIYIFGLPALVSDFLFVQIWGMCTNPIILRIYICCFGDNRIYKPLLIRATEIEHLRNKHRAFDEDVNGLFNNAFKQYVCLSLCLIRALVSSFTFSVHSLPFR